MLCRFSSNGAPIISSFLALFSSCSANAKNNSEFKWNHNKKYVCTASTSFALHCEEQNRRKKIKLKRETYSSRATKPVTWRSFCELNRNDSHLLRMCVCACPLANNKIHMRLYWVDSEHTQSTDFLTIHKPKLTRMATEFYSKCGFTRIEDA